MKAEEVRRLTDLEQENTRLKRLVAELSLDKQILQDLAKKSSQPDRPKTQNFRQALIWTLSIGE
jgi:putative transposase